MNIKKQLPVFLAIIAGFFVLSLIYFSPIIEGDVLKQHDIITYQGASKEIKAHKEATGEYTQWTNSMFSGMPSFIIDTPPNNTTLVIVKSLFSYDPQRPFMILFMYCFFAFIGLLLIRKPLLISALGALAYGLSSYMLIIIEAGHVTKCIALAYMPLIICSFYATYKGRHLVGAAFFSLALALQIRENHIQITYYTGLILIVFVLLQLYQAFRDKQILADFIKPSLFLLIAALLAVGTNSTTLYTTYDYGQYSIRGKSELSTDKNNKTSGLDKDYATSWSYGVGETFTLLIPNSKGGSSQGSLDTESNTYKQLQAQGVPNAERMLENLPLYWGTQPFTSGPVYIGAVICFLFIFGLFLVSGTFRIWMIVSTILGITLSWGHNFMPLTDFFLDYVPLYNKFRSVSMILVIAQFTMPFVAVFAISKLTEKFDKDDVLKKLKYSLGITLGLFVISLIAITGFTGTVDNELSQSGWPEILLDALRSDRKGMFYGDFFRSLFFVLTSSGIIYLYVKQKITANRLVTIFLILIVIDLFPISKRYLNNDDFVTTHKAEQVQRPTQVDLDIMQDKGHYRVMNLTVSPFNDATTSYFHKSIGGYSGAKLRRYQDVIEKHLGKMNMKVYDMLNTKYFITENPQTKEPMVQPNQTALGNAWFVQNITYVPNADKELDALTSFDPSSNAIVDTRFKSSITATSFKKDSTSTIVLVSYAPNKMVYESNNANNGAAVFSEIYLEKGWQATIDGKPAKLFRANYILRALEIPAGKHTIQLTFDYPHYTTARLISLISSILIFVGLGISGFLFYKKQKSLAVTK